MMTWHYYRYRIPIIKVGISEKCLWVSGKNANFWSRPQLRPSIRSHVQFVPGNVGHVLKGVPTGT
jgi:hypothetical protein